MKSMREIHKRRASHILIPLFAALFIFSVSVHNHKIGIGPDSPVRISQSMPGAGHSVEGCSACLLHGHVKLRGASTVVNLIDPGQSIPFIDAEYLIPASYLRHNKPSRSPPAV